MASKKPSPHDDLFKQAMKDVRPLNKINQPQSNHTKQKKIAPQNTDNILYQQADSYLPYKNITGDDVIAFKQDSVQKSQFNRLKRGEITAEASLDLHHHTVAEAIDLIEEFLTFCRQKKCYCVRIIHGKGYMSHDKYPVLKNFIDNYLRQQPYVIAYHSSQPRYGGTGAVDILLRF